MWQRRSGPSPPRPSREGPRRVGTPDNLAYERKRLVLTTVADAVHVTASPRRAPSVESEEPNPAAVRGNYDGRHNKVRIRVPGFLDEPAVEDDTIRAVVEGGEGEIHRSRLGLAVDDQMAAVVADGVVPRMGVDERVTLLVPDSWVTLGEPGEVAADPAGVGAAGVRGQRLRLQVRPVAVKAVREVDVDTSRVRADRVHFDHNRARLLLSEVPSVR